MEPSSNNPQAQQEAAPAVSASQSHSGTGPTIGIIVIVLVLLAGALFFWFGSGMTIGNPDDAENTQATNTQDSSPENSPDVQALMQTTPSDSTAAIDADLEATNIGSAESDLQVQ